MPTKVLRSVVVPTGDLDIVVSYTPREDEAYAHIAIISGGVKQSSFNVEKEDIEHLVAALTEAKKYSK